MKVKSIETLACDAGWRNYHFVKLTTDTGIVGWSEFDEGFGAPGVSTVIERLAAACRRPAGRRARAHLRRALLRHPPGRRRHRRARHGRDRERAARRQGEGTRRAGVRAARRQDPRPHPRVLVALRHLADQSSRHTTSRRSPTSTASRRSGAKCARRASTALKTNIFTYDADQKNPRGWRPGFGVPFSPELNVERDVLRNLVMHLEALRDGAGPDVDILLDLNFNAKTEGYLKILRAIADLDIFWVEIDSYNPEALGYIRRQSPHPISSCETLLGLREFLPYFREQAMDVAIVDTPWNGVWQSMKIAAAAEAHEVNVAPHNFYGHLCTMMNAHFAAAVPNLRIMETDIDRIAWDHELFTHVPEFVDGHLIMPDRPGWGIEPNEEAIRAHPPKGPAGLLNYGRKV